MLRRTTQDVCMYIKTYFNSWHLLTKFHWDSYFIYSGFYSWIFSCIYISLIIKDTNETPVLMTYHICASFCSCNFISREGCDVSWFLFRDWKLRAITFWKLKDTTKFPSSCRKCIARWHSWVSKTEKSFGNSIKNQWRWLTMATTICIIYR